MNNHQLQHDLGKDLILGAVCRKRRARGFLHSVPLVMALAAGMIWVSVNRGESTFVPLVHDEAVVSKPVDPRETRIIQSDEELLDLLEEFGPALAKREDGTQVLMLTGIQP